MAEMYSSKCKEDEEIVATSASSEASREIIKMIRKSSSSSADDDEDDETMRFGGVKIRKLADDDETKRFGGVKVRKFADDDETKRFGVAVENSASYASCMSPESEVVVVVAAAREISSISCSSSCGEEEETEKNRVEKSVVDPEEEVESALTTFKNLDSRSAASSMRRERISDMAISSSMRENTTKMGDLKSDEQDSSTRNLDVNPTVQIKMPSDSIEIEEFFAAAEKNLLKRFSEKYNFDIGKEVPLEGRYEWVPLKP